jgi:hypothetical protein
MFPRTLGIYQVWILKDLDPEHSTNCFWLRSVPFSRVGLPPLFLLTASVSFLVHASERPISGHPTPYTFPPPNLRRQDDLEGNKTLHVVLPDKHEKQVIEKLESLKLQRWYVKLSSSSPWSSQLVVLFDVG